MTRTASGRAAWVIADSALNSLANAGLTIGLARVVSADEYGHFALAFTLFSLSLACSQAVSNSVVAIAFAAAPPDTQRRAADSAAGTAVACGLLAGAIIGIAALVLQAAPFSPVVAMAFGLPLLLLQDSLRSTFVALSEPRRAFLLDALWVGAWATSFAVIFAATQTRYASVYVATWSVAAGITCVVACRRATIVPRVSRTWDWVRTHRGIAFPALANTIAIMGASQIAFLLITVLGDVQDLGALRGVQSLLGPLNIIGFAATAFAIPELVRRAPTQRGYVLAAVAISTVLVFFSAAWGGALMLVPDGLGRELLGDTWPNARSALLGMVLFSCFVNATVGATAVMRALNRVRSTLYVSLALGPGVIIGSAAGVSIAGARGAATGFAVASGLVIVPCWLLLLRDVRLGRRVEATT